VTPLMSEIQPSWSPDRRHVAYSVTQGDPSAGPWQLAVADLDTLRSTAVTAGRDHYEPDWRPDGRQIAFTSYTMSGSDVIASELALVNPDGTGLRTLLALNSPYYAVGNPAWSPDGQRLAFTLESTATGGEIYVLDPQRATYAKLYDHPGWDDIDPAWSPDGRFLAFASGTVRMSGGGAAETRHDIWMLDTTTGVAGAVAVVADWDLRGPAWSPDGSQIVFSALYQKDPKAWGLYVVHWSGGTVSPLTWGVEPDWASGFVPTLPTPVASATATPTYPPQVPTFPAPPTVVPPAITPGPTPTSAFPPTFVPPVLPTHEATPTPGITATDEPTSGPSPSATFVEPTPTAPPLPVPDHVVFLPITFDTVGAH
jgi:Tol biopolymer transport system component